MISGGSTERITLTGFSLREIMSKSENIDASTTDSEVCGKRLIRTDIHLHALLNAECISNPDEQEMVLGPFVTIGLANLLVSTSESDPEMEEHYYVSTKAMRKLVKRWLYAKESYTA
jgi:hypothetical protein